MRGPIILFVVFISVVSRTAYAEQQVSSGPSSTTLAEQPKGDTARDSKEVASKPDVPLSPPALEAVRVSEKWRGENISPIAGADGRAIYSFGAGLPTVVCAPLRVCIIELQPGEKLEGEPQIGDSVRWNISPALYGNGDQVTPIIVLKPQMAGLDTNLLITTDRRAYYLRLISKPQDYVARVAFQYPADQSTQKWQEQLAQQRQRERETKVRSDSTPAMIAVEKMNFDYKVTGAMNIFGPRESLTTAQRPIFKWRQKCKAAKHQCC